MLFPSTYRNYLRRLGWLLAGWVVVVGLSSLPAIAQTDSPSSFCISNSEALTDSVQGRSYGDPHINTYDRFHYSFQTLGEYILTRSADGNFEVQARQNRVVGRDNLSLNTAVAMNVCGDRVALYLQDLPDGNSTPLRLEGLPTPFEADAVPLPSGGEVQQLGSGDYAIIWPSGDQVLIHSIQVGGNTFYNIMPTLSRRHAQTMSGLLGNFNGNPDDDLMSRDGTVIPARSTYSVATNALDSILPAAIPVRNLEDAYFDDLYRQFGDSWR
ncbi:MAG: VWD domain-containing protein, partial [Cyanobacteria bacterium P01_H01_bin.153]